MDWMVHATSAALVSCGDRLCHVGHGTRRGVDVFPATTLENRVLLHCDTVGNRCHSDRKLYVSELPGAVAGCAFAGRSIPRKICPGEMESRGRGLCIEACADLGRQAVVASSAPDSNGGCVRRERCYARLDLLRYHRAD